MAAEWNLSNADVECKAVLEKLLRPNHFKMIPNFLVQATPQQKKAMASIAQCLDYQTRGNLRSEVLKERSFSKLGYQKNVPVRPNGFGMPTLANAKSSSLDRAALDDGFKSIHMCAGPRSRGRFAPGPGGGNNPHCRYRSGKEMDRSYSLGYKPLRQQKVAHLLHPQALAWTEKFLLQESTTQDRSRLVHALEHIQTVFDQIPGYVDMKEQNKNLPGSGAASPAGGGAVRRSASTGALNRTIQDDLYDHSKIIHRKHPSQLMYEYSKMGTHYEPPVSTGPPPQPEVKKDQRSNVYFPGNNQKLISSYNETFVTFGDQGPRAPIFSRPKSAAVGSQSRGSLEPLGKSSSTPALRPASAPGGGQRIGTRLSPRTFYATRMRPRSLSNCFPPNQDDDTAF